MKLLKKNKAMSKRTIAIVTSVVVVVGGIAIGATYMKYRNVSQDVVISREREYTVKKGDLTAGTSGTGTIKFNQVTQNFKEIVQLEEVFVKEGQKVKKGDKIASISLEFIEKNIEELNLKLEQANRALDTAKNNKQSTTLSQDKAINDSLDASKSQYENSKRTINKTINDIKEKINVIENKLKEIQNKLNNLSGDTEGNKDEILGLKQEQEALSKEKEQLEEQLKSVNSDLIVLEEARKSELEKEAKTVEESKKINNIALSEADNAIANAQSEVDKIKEDINKFNTLKENSILYAETDGIVLAIGYKAGSTTTLDNYIVAIGESDNIEAEITISQSDITKIAEGQEVTLNVDAFQEQKFKGKVKFINLKPNSEGNSTTYTVRIEIEKNDFKLIDGMTVSAQFVIKEVNDVLILSNRAITIKDGKQIVNLKGADGVNKEVEITTGFSDGKSSEIVSGLSEGDTVIVGGE